MKCNKCKRSQNITTTFSAIRLYELLTQKCSQNEARKRRYSQNYVPGSLSALIPVPLISPSSCMWRYTFLLEISPKNMKCASSSLKRNRYKNIASVAANFSDINSGTPSKVMRLDSATENEAQLLVRWQCLGSHAHEKKKRFDSSFSDLGDSMMLLSKKYKQFNYYTIHHNVNHILCASHPICNTSYSLMIAASFDPLRGPIPTPSFIF